MHSCYERTLLSVVAERRFVSRAEPQFCKSFIPFCLRSANLIVAGYFVGADKLGGKYASAGLLLGTPISKGHYIGGERLALVGNGLLTALVKGKLDHLFVSLLEADPFRFDPLAVAKNKKGRFQTRTETALTAGGDIVSSKLQLKLDALASALGLKTTAGDLLDSANKTKEGISRGAIDSVEALAGDHTYHS